MARIKQLSPLEAQKIAAGEVVERPANVVKELVENAIDAQASQITIYIQDAGKSLIRVIDDGHGMSPEDAYLCFSHHATSKITHVDDLPHLTTFGFRGEALSSIAAVSKVSLTTKEPQTTSAIKIVLENNTILKEEFLHANHGTDILIEDLFFNVPARKKFLKTTQTELRQIMLLFQAFCLAYPAIHFKLFSQETLIHNCPVVSDMQQRIAQLWDHTVTSQTIPININNDTITLQGVITNHMYNRYDRSSIFFFVNNRWVKNYPLTKSLLKGYANVLPADKYPLASLALKLDPSLIDINIHPRKEEIQFLHPRIIEELTYSTVKGALENHLSAQLKKSVTFKIEPAKSFPYQTNPTFTTIGYPLPEDSPNLTLRPNNTLSHVSNTVFQTNTFIEKNIPLEVAMPNYTIIGQFKKTYILIEQEDSLFLIDQHAAHERILYEMFAQRFEKIATIHLMFPLVVTLTSEQTELLEPHMKIFSDNNIVIEPFGSNQFIIQAVPVHLKEVSLEELIHQTIGWIRENQNCQKDQFYKKINEKLHAQMACKAAVKAGDTLSQAQMNKLLSDLEQTENRFTCPHGRPTGWNLMLYDIEKKFKRKL